MSIPVGCSTQYWTSNSIAPPQRQSLRGLTFEKGPVSFRASGPLDSSEGK